jgi:hypothetical protein
MLYVVKAKTPKKTPKPKVSSEPLIHTPSTAEKPEPEHVQRATVTNEGSPHKKRRVSECLPGHVLAERLVNDTTRDVIAQTLETKGIITIQDLLKAVDISLQGFTSLQDEFNLLRPVSRLLRPFGEVLQASAVPAVGNAVQVSALETAFHLSKGDAMDLYDYLRENIE